MKILRLRIHQERKSLQSTRIGFTIPKGTRLSLAPKNHQVQASGMSRILIKVGMPW